MLSHVVPSDMALPSPEPDLRIIEPLCAVFRRRLKQEGLKYTPERANILDAIIRLSDTGEVFQAERLLEFLRQPGRRVSKATVYRTIKLLTDAGVLQQVLFDADQAHYHLAYGARDSGVVVRTDTGDVTTLHVPELAAIRDRVREQLGLTCHGHRLIVYAQAGSPQQP